MESVVLAHWYQRFDEFSFSTQDFCERLSGELARRNMPEAKLSRVGRLQPGDGCMEFAESIRRAKGPIPAAGDREQLQRAAHEAQFIHAGFRAPGGGQRIRNECGDARSAIARAGGVLERPENAATALAGWPARGLSDQRQ